MAGGLRLFFLRHGPADRSEFTGGDDDQRPLTETGRRRMRTVAGFVAGLEPDLDLVITSPLVRAAQTAEIVAARLGLDRALRTDARLGHGFDLPALAAVLAGLASDHRRILLVGHEPGFSTVIGELIGGGEIRMKKGALARVDLLAGRGPRGQLVWLLQPRVLLNCDRAPDDGERGTA